MVWILPTRDRPEMCRRTLEACAETGFEGPGTISVDGRMERRDLGKIVGWGADKHPAWEHCWDLIVHQKPIGVMAQLNWFLDEFSDASCYGCISDDMIPRTHGWQQRLEEAAGDWNIAYCRDGMINGFKEDGRPWMSGAWCIGGELVRTVGWLGLPGTFRSSTDIVYCAIGDRLGLMRYLDDVVVEHQHWQNGTRERDRTDSYSDPNDHVLIRQWGNGLRRPGFEATVRKIEAAMAQKEAA